MVSAATEYFKGTKCAECGKPVNDPKGVLYAITPQYASSSPKFKLFHTSPKNCLDKYNSHGYRNEGVAATWDTVDLIERPTFEDFAQRGFQVIATPEEIADKIVEYSNNNCYYTNAKVNGADKSELARLGINADDIVTAILLYSGATWSDLGKLIEELKTAPTFGAEALFVQSKSDFKNTYVLPFFKEPITVELMRELGISLAK